MTPAHQLSQAVSDGLMAALIAVAFADVGKRDATIVAVILIFFPVIRWAMRIGPAPRDEDREARR
jgi:hypothetical protein